LIELASSYRDRFGVDVRELRGSGAAGGLAGGLAALGARIRPGFEVVADRLDLRALATAADLVFTGEGRLDETSLLGQAPVQGVRMCADVGTPVAVVVGEAAVSLPVPVVALVDRLGRERAQAAPLPEIRLVTAEMLGRTWGRVQD